MAVVAVAAMTVAWRVTVDAPLDAGPTLGLKIGAYGDPAQHWPRSGITNVYLNIDENAEGFPRERLRDELGRGLSLNVTISARWTQYLAGIADNEDPAMSWLTAYVRNIQQLADYSQRLDNGTYVVATIWHESQPQIQDGYVTGASADFRVIGRAQQRAIALGKRLAPDAYWSIWLAGFDRTVEGIQLAQVTDPKPDLITIDPYANRDCQDTLESIAASDLAWVRQQPAYDGVLAISETGMTATCRDDQLAAFYRDIPEQLRGLGDDVRFYVMFNRDSGRYPHLITDGRFPLAASALRASMRS